MKKKITFRINLLLKIAILFLVILSILLIFYKNKIEKFNNYKKKIAIFNSFPFHYEMFGYILNFAKNNNYNVDIFTTTKNNLEYLDFYKKLFNNFNIIDYNLFSEKNKYDYKYIFLTTNDDKQFNIKNDVNNIISIHHKNNDEKKYKYNLTIAKLKNTNLDYAITCYPIFYPNDKILNTNITIIGNSLNKNKYILDKLYSKNKITLNIINRYKQEYNNDKFEINNYINISTHKLMEILKKSTFIIINYTSSTYDIDNNYGERASGSIGLAYSTLNKIIISKKLNKIYELKNVYEFDDNDIINLDNIYIDFNELQKSRDQYIELFDKYIKNIK
jgi:hypothetical protein